MVNLYLKPCKSKLEQPSSDKLLVPYDLGSAGALEHPDLLVVVSDCRMASAARAVLLCRPNSHPFQERTLVLEQAVKVGRSVARARPAPHNGIFDCKVLSRNHALLWYENGKFYLQDTKSSNGTFVNNQRLSKGSEESTPREVCSGDIVQFGVDVMENSRKVTHGCIVATLKLYLPDGKEAKASPSTVMLPSCPSTIATQDLYALAECLQEALHREQMLENKLATLQKLVSNTEEASESSWKALIDEDRLLTRLEILENQVQTSSKNINDETIRQEVVRLQEDKDQYQVSAKETLRKAYQEKLEAVLKLAEVERQLNNSENECKNLQLVYESTQRELQELAERYNGRLKEIQDLTDKLEEAEVKDKLSEKGDHDAKRNSLNEDNDVTNDQTNITKVSIGDIDNSSIDGEDSPTEITFPALRSTQGVQVNMIIDGNLNDDLPENHWPSKEVVDELSTQIKESEKELQEYKAKVVDLTMQLREAKTQAENGTLRIKQLQEQIEKMEEDLQGQQEVTTKDAAKENKDARLTIIYKSEVETTPTVTLPMPRRSASPRPSSPRPSSPLPEVVVTATVTANGEVTVPTVTPATIVQQNGHEPSVAEHSLRAEIDKLKELLAETRENKMRAEREVIRFKAELEDARNNVKKAADDANVLRQQLQTVQVQAQEKGDVVAKLQDQLKRSELALMDVNQQISSLKDRISQDQQRLRLKHDEVDLVRQQLTEAQHNYKQAHNETEQLRNKVESLNRQLERHAVQELENASLEEETRMLTEESRTLKTTIQNLEASLRQVKNEKAKLMEEHKRAAARPRSADVSAIVSPQDIELLQEEVEASQRKLQEAYSEIINLKQTCEAYHEERTRLRRERDTSGQDSQILRFLVPLLLAGILFYVLRW